MPSLVDAFAEALEAIFQVSQVRAQHDGHVDSGLFSQFSKGSNFRGFSIFYVTFRDLIKLADTYANDQRLRNFLMLRN